MAPTAATKARTTKAKPKDDGADTALSEVLDEKTGKHLTIQQLKNKLRNEAEREVLDAHKDEVHRITGAKYQAHGLEYVRRLSEEEKAAKLIEELHAKFPNLRPQAEQQQAQAEVPMSSSTAAGLPDAGYVEDIQPEGGLGYVSENGE